MVSKPGAAEPEAFLLFMRLLKGEECPGGLLIVSQSTQHKSMSNKILDFLYLMLARVFE